MDEVSRTRLCRSAGIFATRRSRTLLGAYARVPVPSKAAAPDLLAVAGTACGCNGSQVDNCRSGRSFPGRSRRAHLRCESVPMRSSRDRGRLSYVSTSSIPLRYHYGYNLNPWRNASFRPCGAGREGPFLLLTITTRAPLSPPPRAPRTQRIHLTVRRTCRRGCTRRFPPISSDFPGSRTSSSIPSCEQYLECSDLLLRARARIMVTCPMDDVSTRFLTFSRVDLMFRGSVMISFARMLHQGRPPRVERAIRFSLRNQYIVPFVPIKLDLSMLMHDCILHFIDVIDAPIPNRR